MKVQAPYTFYKSATKAIFLILITILSLSTVVNAQKKKPLKVPPIKKASYPSPPKIKKEVTEAPPPMMGMGAPMVSVSPGEAKYEREKICTDCDTLVLEPNKKHILIYDVKWMSNRESRTYNEQPTAKDLEKDYFKLHGENLREWEELKANFPENEFSYHHIFRNTYIKTPNNTKQVLNLLDRQDRHEGFLYWSGKEKDSTIKRTNMVLLTEMVAKQNGLKKISSYYEKFKIDSLSIVNYQQTKNPSPNIMANMNTFLLKEVIRETVFPIAFFDVAKVSKISIQSQSDERKKLTFTLNTKGQITEIMQRNDALSITYKDNLPSSIKDGSRVLNIYYQGDTVIFKDNNYLNIYKQVGKMFFSVKTYLISDDNYSKMNLDNGFESKLSNKANDTCLKQTNETRGTTVIDCYSNTNWQLPLNRTSKTATNDRIFEGEMVYRKLENSLVIEDLNSSRSSKMVYTLVDNKPTKLETSTKRGNEDYGKSYVLDVAYEYFK